jgi:hypothetical protein
VCLDPHWSHRLAAVDWGGADGMAR